MSAQTAEADAENEAEVFEEEEYEEFDEFDDEEEEERGLSGLVVLLMGVVMLGAFASVVWIAYQQGIKNGPGADQAPYVAADPDPLKIENDRPGRPAAGNDRQVYDRLEGTRREPVETLAKAPEEPVARSSADPIGDIAASTAGEPVVDDAVADRIASLAAQDEALSRQPIAPAAQQPPAQQPAAQQPAARQPAAQQPAAPQPRPAAPAPTAGAGALSGTHVVQVGAFGSQNEADTNWSRMQTRLGDFVSGKSPDVERADLGARGVFYRLRIGPFSSSADAKTFCDGLKTRGQDCLVKAK